MQAEISKQTKHELLRVLHERYIHASKYEKSKILDEFVAVARCHRKHAIRLITRAQPAVAETPALARRIYSEAVREAPLSFGRPQIASVGNASKRSCLT